MPHKRSNFIAAGLVFSVAVCWAEQSATEKGSAAAADIFSTPPSPPASPAKEKAAAAATEWLGIMDKGNYADAWQAGSSYFRAVVKQEVFEQKMQTLRKPLGKLISRALVRIFYRTQLPGTPDGEYVVIRFDTVFENKPLAVETVSWMLDKDGQWRVAGYFIKINEPTSSVPQSAPPPGKP